MQIDRRTFVGSMIGGSFLPTNLLFGKEEIKEFDDFNKLPDIDSLINQSPSVYNFSKTANPCIIFFGHLLTIGEPNSYGHIYSKSFLEKFGFKNFSKQYFNDQISITIGQFNFKTLLNDMCGLTQVFSIYDEKHLFVSGKVQENLPKGKIFLKMLKNKEIRLSPIGSGVWNYIDGTNFCHIEDYDLLSIGVYPKDKVAIW